MEALNSACRIYQKFFYITPDLNIPGQDPGDRTLKEEIRMMSREEISRFKKNRTELEKRMERIGKERCAKIVWLAEPLKDLIAEIESTKERDKSLWNPDISTKLKLAKKSARFMKQLGYFETHVRKELQEGKITEDVSKRFLIITDLVRGGKFQLANDEFGYFDDIIELSKNHERANEEMKEKERALMKEQERVKRLLDELSWLEKQEVDEKKVGRYVELLERVEELERIRSSFLSSLASEPIVKLLEDAAAMHLPGLPEDAEMARIKEFFSSYPDLGGYHASQICELFTFSEKKLSHVCPETTRFKKTILANKNLFEMLNGLERSGSLAVQDEKSLDFFAANIGGAPEVVDRIRLLRPDMSESKAEFEKKRKLDEMRGALSGNSKESLEKELGESESLLEFLHSPEEQAEGFLSRLSSFLKNWHFA